MRRKPLAAVLALLSAALVLGGNALLDAGWGSALRSIADRVLPNPEITMWAPAPEPGSHASSYADATGSGANYVYLVDAADDRGNVRELQLIFFGRESNGEGWLEIEARGGPSPHDCARWPRAHPGNRRRPYRLVLSLRGREGRCVGSRSPPCSPSSPQRSSWAGMPCSTPAGGRRCARGSGPLSAALVQCRREFQEVEHGEDTGSG